MSETNNEVNEKNILMKVRQKRILQQIFNNLSLDKYLNIIRYNKHIKKKVEINIDDYKNEYFKIKIEIIPVGYEFGTFINMFHKESYYHIYINDSTKESKGNKISNHEYPTKITIIIDNKFKSLYGLFRECRSIEKIKFIKFNRTDINNMRIYHSYELHY